MVERAVSLMLRLIFLLAVLCVRPVSGVEAEARPVIFRTEIAPLLQRRRAACHCEESAKSGYRLDSFRLLQKAGDGGDAPVIAGKAKESALFKLLLEKDPEDRMPQKANALPASEIAFVERWLNAGATFDGGDPARPLAELVRETFLRPAPAHYARPEPITALAFNGDGKRLAVSGYREVMIWDPAIGTLERRLGGMPERISVLAWHPKRNLLAVAGGTPGQWGTVALVDVSHGYAIRFLCDLLEMVLSVVFDHNGDTLVAGCGNRTMRIFNVSGGKQTRILRQHADWVQAVVFNPKGTSLVSVSRDRTARVFDTVTWELDAAHEGHDTPCSPRHFPRTARVSSPPRAVPATCGIRKRRTSAATLRNSATTCGNSQPAHSASQPDAATARCASTRATVNSRGSHSPATTTPCNRSPSHHAANGSPVAVPTAK